LLLLLLLLLLCGCSPPLAGLEELLSSGRTHFDVGMWYNNNELEKYSIKVVCIDEGLLDGGGIASEKGWPSIFFPLIFS
jgi:hypothetical protein